MLIKKPTDLKYSDVTPKHIYESRPRLRQGLNRRRFLGASAAALGSLALPSIGSATPIPGVKATGMLHNLTGDDPVPKANVTGYNNFYEFGTGKDEPAKNAPEWKPDPEWPVKIDGEVSQRKILNLDEIKKIAPLEERIYRHRCVEGWSIVVPWVGIPLSALLKQVEPTGKAKYVSFQSYYDPKLMLSSRAASIDFPYVEGLRLDEAMHPLTFLAVGLYGETLPNQNGAPLRLVVPWKYGFKSIKSIVRIQLTEKQPATTWNLSWPEAYGFYSNVNPNRPHPRFDQDTEDRLDGTGFLGQGRRIATTMFNGYGNQVGDLYSKMDLIRNY